MKDECPTCEGVGFIPCPDCCGKCCEPERCWECKGQGWIET